MIINVKNKEVCFKNLSLDKFCHQKTEAGYSKIILFVIKIILNLSYEQAPAKRKFIINNKALDRNIIETKHYCFKKYICFL